MKLAKRLGICTAAAVMTVTALGLTACGGDGGPTHFTIWLPSGESSQYYGINYEENPVVKYLESKTWMVDGQEVQLSFEWKIPTDDPTGSLTREISTKSYADVIDVSSASNVMSVMTMYEEGMALDLTEYVEKYMPNYVAFLEENPTLAQTATNVVDGEKKYLQIWAYQGDNERMWGGWLYRRDWLVKYGTNPSTGAPFTSQGWTKTLPDGTNDAWVDDVMFPSWYGLDAQGNAMTGPNGQNFREWFLENVDSTWDGSAPVTISDWEWMLQIFENALADMNIANSYVMGMYYPGYYEVGDLACSFGGGGPTWYLSDNKTKANFGMTSDNFRQYLIVANKWYEEGWINPSFNESNKIFYESDTSEAAQGRVAVWWGQNGQMMDRIENESIAATQGACVYGARQPINTTYGPDSSRYAIPTLMYQTGQEMRSFVITNKAEDKDIAAFCTMMDYMYTEEGAVLQGFGLNKEQYEEYKAATGETIEIMEEFADENGDVVIQDSDGLWDYCTNVTADAQEDAIRGSRLWGYCPRWDLQSKQNYPETMMKVQNEWVAYRMTGDISNSLLAQLDSEASDTFADLKTSLRSFGEQNIYRYVKGEFDPNDDGNWNTLVRRVNALGVNEGTQILQDLLDSLNG